MIPLVVAGILWLPTGYLALFMALIIGAGAWEWGRIVPLHDAASAAFSGVILALAGLTWLLNPQLVAGPLLGAAFGWWLWVLYWLSHPYIGAGPGAASRSLKLAAGALVLLPAWTALVVLHGRGEDGPLLTLFLLIVIWLADSGAYFSGRRWGRRKLAPAISPGKTREGVYGALLASGSCALAVGLLYNGSLRWAAGLTLVVLVTVMFSIGGDLLESLMKRQCGVKDSGNIIPGHGGILDRIDSLTAAAPVFLLGLYWMKL
jgi:phosphatidate cytidylyltransferase